MRAHELLSERSGLTDGDLAETFFGAAVAAAFIHYPKQANEAQMLTIIKSLKHSNNLLSYIATNTGQPADTVIVENVINMVKHRQAFDKEHLNDTIEKMRGAFVSILASANDELRSNSSKINAENILENGIADTVTIKAIGGESQSATKVDVVVKHENPEITPISQKYSLKYDSRLASLITVGQSPGVAELKTDKNTGQIKTRDQLTFWNDIGVIINKNSDMNAWKKANNSIRFKSDGKTPKYTDENDKKLAKERRKTQAFKDTIEHMKEAALQITTLIDTNPEEATFLANLERFLGIHVTKGEDMKILSLTSKPTEKGKPYKLGHLDNIKQNLDKINLSANFKNPPKVDSPPELLVYNTYEGKKEILIQIRLITSGGYHRLIKDGYPKDRYSGLRYRLNIAVGPAFSLITTQYE